MRAGTRLHEGSFDFGPALTLHSGFYKECFPTSAEEKEAEVCLRSKNVPDVLVFLRSSALLCPLRFLGNSVILYTFIICSPHHKNSTFYTCKVIVSLFPYPSFLPVLLCGRILVFLAFDAVFFTHGTKMCIMPSHQGIHDSMTYLPQLR